MNSQTFCKSCNEATYYECVTCIKPTCNRPQCSITIPESTEGYRETPPKRVAQCNDCHASSSVGDVVKIEIQRPFVITNFDIDNSDEEEEDEEEKE